MRKDIVKKWIEYANADLDAAERLFKSPKPTHWTYLLVLWHCHQVVEKMIKMVVAKHGKEILKIHDLPRLSKLADLKLSKKDKELIKNLNEFYIRPRYPDLIYIPLPKTTKSQTRDYLKGTKKFIIWLQKK